MSKQIKRVRGWSLNCLGNPWPFEPEISVETVSRTSAAPSFNIHSDQGYKSIHTHTHTHTHHDKTDHSIGAAVKRQRHDTWYIAAYRCALRSSALQPWKWQLTGIGYSTAAQASGTLCPHNGLLTRSYAARRTTPQSATLGLHPVIHVPNYIDYYSFTDPWGMVGWVGHVGWPIADGLTTKWSTIQLAVWRRMGKVRRLRPAF